MAHRALVGSTVSALWALTVLSTPVLAADVPSGAVRWSPAEAQKLGVVRAEDEARPTGPISWPGAPGAEPADPDALSCPSPCTTGTLSASHPYYDVYLSCGNGAFTARTGALHSVTAIAGSPQNVIFGGAGGAPGTSDVTFYVHETATAYLNPGGGAACVFDPPDTPTEPGSVGVESEWTQNPLAGVTLTLREEIVAFGSIEADSGVRLTMSMTNNASSTASVTVGFRWQIDYQNTSDDGPLYAPVTCDPPSVGAELWGEHEFAPAEILDFYRIQNNTGTPIFSNVTSTTPISGFPDTDTPDRLIFGAWPSLRGSPWNYVASEGNPGVDSDSATLNYYGYTPATGFRLAPGESIRRSVVIFTSADLIDCGEFVPGCSTTVTVAPADQVICRGDSTVLDASGVTLTDCTGTVRYVWSDGLGPFATTPSVMVSPAVTTDYTVTLTCSTDPDCTYTDHVLVEVQEKPDIFSATAGDPSPCNGGIKLQWPDAIFRDPTASGTYHVYRSEVSCADALARPPIVMGLPTPGWVDVTTVPGVTYYYVIMAEDARAPTVCSPPGPEHGGAVDTFCLPPVVDQVTPGTPAGVYSVLRASHQGQDVTFEWPAARALLTGEHFHLLKSWDVPLTPFVHVNGEGDRSRSYSERDVSARRQFFDLRVANACENLSIDEYPPGWDR